MQQLTPAIIGHLVGDYLLQNDWMALNKKKSSWHCLVHCCIWTWSVVLFAGWVSEWSHLSAFIVLFTTHFVQDRTNIINRYMALIGQKQFATGPCAPWSTIVVDNVWHMVTIWAVWKFII